MIKHIVTFKILGQDLEDKKNKVLELKRRLDELKDKIKEIKFLETGINFSDRPVAHDLILITEFDSIEGLNIYRDHPDHQEVVQYINTIKDSIVVVDYEKN